MRLVSNRPRKFFEDKASLTTLSPPIAAFIMGDKTKLNATGHMPLVYNMILRPAETERLIEQYAKSGLDELLDLSRNQTR